MGKTEPSAEEDMAVLIAKASEIGPQLDEATDLLNRGIAEAENQIAALKLGVTAAVDFDLPGDDEEPHDFKRLLSFGKLGDKWRLLVEWGCPPPETWSSVPLLNANKEMRLLAVNLFEKLLSALVLEAAKQRADVMEQANRALKFAASVAKSAVYAAIESAPTAAPVKTPELSGSVSPPRSPVVSRSSLGGIVTVTTTVVDSAGRKK
jgi:hypothetical protein